LKRHFLELVLLQTAVIIIGGNNLSELIRKLAGVGQGRQGARCAWARGGLLRGRGDGEGRRQGGSVGVLLEALEVFFFLAIGVQRVECGGGNVDAAVDPVGWVIPTHGRGDEVGGGSGRVSRDAGGFRGARGRKVKNRLRGGLVEEAVEETQTGDAPAVGEALELDALDGTEDADGSVLDAVEGGQLRGGGSTPNRAQVLKTGSDVGLVDRGEGFVGEKRAETREEREGHLSVAADAGDVGAPGEVA
jgi:hypothetical protein